MSNIRGKKRRKEDNPNQYLRLFSQNLENARSVPAHIMLFFIVYVMPMTQMGNKVHVTGDEMEAISLSSGYSISRIKQLFSGCVEHWLLLKIMRGSFYVNPLIAYKGSMRGRDELIDGIREGKIPINNLIGNPKKEAPVNGITLKKSKLHYKQTI